MTAKICETGTKPFSKGAIDEASALGDLIVNIFAALAQFEQRLIQERARTGLGRGTSTWKNGTSPQNGLR